MRRMETSGHWSWGFLVIGVLSWAALRPECVRADQITVKGAVLHGTVTAVTPKGIEFLTEYGEGKIAVTMTDLEGIETDTPYHLFHGDEQTDGRIVGIRNGKLLVGDTLATAEEVDPAELHMAYSDAVYNQTGLGFLRRYLSLWRGSFDVGFGLTQATVDTLGIAVGFAADRKKKPTRFTLGAGYRYGRQKDKEKIQRPDGTFKNDTDSSTLENEIRGFARGEYDIFTKWYLFGQGDAEYDEIEKLSIRGIPKAGVGYRFWETETFLLQAEAGGAYVYEKFFGGDTNDYFAIAFGKLLEWDLPWYGMQFAWRTDYLPAVDDWANDFLVRTDASFLLPMLDYLKFKFGVIDQYDNTPAEGSEENSLAIIAGLSLVF